LKEDELSKEVKPYGDRPFDVEEPAAAASAVDAQPSVPPAVERFRSCRWRKAPDNGTPECCGHRDVLPLTGTGGFTPESWCPGCDFYKLRRTPRKREDYGFGY
jgi:hypothetical protein